CRCGRFASLPQQDRPPAKFSTSVEKAVEIRGFSAVSRANSSVCRGYKTGISMTGTIWDAVLGRIETKVNRNTYYNWFERTALIGDDGGVIAVRVPDAMVVEWLTKHYAAVLDEALTEVGRQGARVTFVPERGESAAETAAPAPAALEPHAVPDASLAPFGDVGLSPRYSFDTFIVGASNQFANAACRAVAE